MATAFQEGKELSQLARFLFDRASRCFWWGWALEAIAGGLALFFGLVDLSAEAGIVGAVTLAVILAAAYVLRLASEDQHNTAETMRRQSVFSEALGWPVTAWQYSRWIERSGERAMKRLGLEPREDDYYATTSSPGARRLAEMTLESAFYTRQVYSKLGWRLWILTGASVLVLVVLIVSAAIRAVPDSSALLVSMAVFLSIPILLGLDLLGWAIRLGRLQSGIGEVERDLEATLKEGLKEERILRLVAEYNCLTVVGMPVPGWLFRRWHDGIKAQWDQRLRAIGFASEVY